MERRWGTKDQDVALKLQELSVGMAGGRSCQGIPCCHKSHCQLPGEIDPPTFCCPALTHPHIFFSYTSHHASLTFLCKELLCCHEQETGTSVGGRGHGL